MRPPPKSYEFLSMEPQLLFSPKINYHHQITPENVLMWLVRASPITKCTAVAVEAMTRARGL
jgi:hypothetical protein